MKPSQGRVKKPSWNKKQCIEQHNKSPEGTLQGEYTHNANYRRRKKTPLTLTRVRHRNLEEENKR